MTTTEKWEIIMKKQENTFAMIETNNAIFDRVAIVDDLPSILVVQFPKRKRTPKGRDPEPVITPSENFTIVQENIPKREIVRIKPYTN